MDLLTERLITELTDANDNQAAFRRFSELMGELGFEQILYALVRQNNEDFVDDAIILDTFDREWMSFYMKHDLIRKDPVAWHVANNKDPVFFPDIYRKVDQSAVPDLAFKEGANLSRDWGVKNAVSAQITAQDHTTATFTLLMPSDLPEQEAEDHLKREYGRAASLFETFHAYCDQAAIAQDHFALTPREIEVLKWLSDGLVAKQIAHKTATSVFTVQKQITSARRRLRAATATQAVAKALIWRLI
ncbi:hypothetical protein MXMO3_03694 (plasmid) [Maritalea myrionectae]|uniref:HTH luxR-type domain-containing protein n=1 Tax=Maritalea myrionectae TaxID=454601 RepID=A0A2R4MJM8_9HYPH|nr:autoinducer binding domain-containing protein [Maritalea myrionectae]AVX06197.1 hypothetical protein MXMO3_03694 [Maritalea myrionectae]